MSITNIKKINVRSPFYIEVKKAPTPVTPPADPQDPEEPQEDPTEVTPTDLTTAMACGDTVVVGQDVGIRKYTVDQDERTGNHTLSISGVTAPVKFTATWNGNTETTKYIGQEVYRQEMLNAGILDADLDLTNSTDPVSDSLVINKTAATPSAIEFKAESAIIHNGFNISLACPAALPDASPVSSEAVIVISSFDSQSAGFQMSMSLNGTTLETPRNALNYAGVLSQKVNVRHVFSDVSPSLEPELSTKFLHERNHLTYRNNYTRRFNNERANSVDNNPAKVYYKSQSVLSTGINTLVLEGNGSNFDSLPAVIISRLPVYEYQGTDYIEGSLYASQRYSLSTTSPTSIDGQHIVNRRGQIYRITIKFKGSSSTELEVIEAYSEVKYTFDSRSNEYDPEDPNRNEFENKRDITSSFTLRNIH